MSASPLPCTRFLPLFFLLLLPLCLADPRTTVAYLVCSNATTPPPSLQSFVSGFVSGFVSAIASVAPQVHSRGYALVSAGSPEVYMFAECIGDLKPVDCDLCVAWAKTQILRCSPYQQGTRGGTLFGDGCFLRYETYDFFLDRSSNLGQEKTICGTEDYKGGDVGLFSETVAELGRNLSVEGIRNGGFYAGEAARGNVSVYGLVQCWEFSKGKGDCAKCLIDGLRRASSCVPKTEGKGLSDGCYVRFSTQKFYNTDTSPRPFRGDEGQQRLGIILASTLSTFAFLMVIAATAISLRMRIARRRKERWQMGLLADSVNKSKLNFSYECLEKASNYFHPSNKLGQGGFGSVYKGTLPDGRVVAIKRLVFNTRQWVEHFFNEVNLISDIDHVNLVKMLGCSVTGPESLLVYEYVPNHCLTEHLFAAKKQRKLSWDLRFKIILGTAKGLAYLHEESYLRIIHRDIKLSNVLIDEDFTPKIADFGLARLFPEDETHISTAIAGTLGYMAPEYVVRGQLTEKADVYSYGVLVIEVVCRMRNNHFIDNSCSILQMVWLMYRSGRLAEVVDGSLDFFPEEEACLVLRVGLLCVQAAPELRPSMSMVVRMLKEECEIPEPMQPPFLSSSISLSSRHDIPIGCYDSQADGHSSSSCEGTTTDSFTKARRIAEIKQRDWQISIRDLMYMVILFKFSEITVHLVLKLSLSKCIYYGRLEKWPGKDRELESIHGIDTLEMIKEHIAAAIGFKADSSVTESWAITQVQRPRLGKVYASSIFYGYFLKSVSMRHNLEHTLALTRLGHSSQKCNYGWSNLLFVRINRFQTGRSLIMEEKISEKLQCYVSGFDKETLQRRMKVRSKEAADLIEKHTCALFGDGMAGLVESSDQTILTSFLSLRRLILEGVVFDSFLWDVEEYIDTAYKLNDN